ncbi:hypothetical protein [Aromatoleum buckelii]|uniref:ParB/Sulfiredoxin domain-containing protein n=1 Tax=Aromatoleum buckelii TaxID=200254 RepID=A0ABX1N8B4_9RHOO|nr:hypothetical protein [Aromatoleum buckelii]MCK0512349.1 hypothetical protein [Aromatoleum buckelii]
MTVANVTEQHAQFFGRLIEESQQRQPMEVPGDILPVKDIQIRESVFQHRERGSGQSLYHEAELTKALQGLRSDEDLEPITVWWSGAAWYCIDGHHRLKAYRSARPDRHVPAKAFEGTLTEAYAEALRANSRTKLPMTPRERREAAWRLVMLGIGTKKEQRLNAGVSDGLIATMRRVRTSLKDAKPSEPLPASWWQAQCAAKGLEAQPYTEEMHDEKVTEIVEKLAKTFGRTLSNKPHMFWDALERYDLNLFKQMWQMPKEEGRWDDD